MEHIRDIEIKNFKSIRQQKIEGCRRVNVFIGYPNVGKSNILEALSLFSIGEDNLNFSDFIRSENLTTLFYNGEVSKKLEIRINDKHRYVGLYQKDVIFFEQQFANNDNSFKRVDSGIIYVDNIIDVFEPKKFKLTIGNSEKRVVDFKVSGIGKENELIPIRKYEFLKKIQYSNQGYSQLSYPYGNNIFNIIQANEKIINEISELFAEYNLEFLYDSRMQQFAILKKVGKKIFTIPYDLVADTLQRVIFYKAAICSSQNIALLFEEPEAHMFPPYISKLTSDIIFDKNDNQYFIATHSPFVINDFMEDLDVAELSVYAVGYEKETGETIIRRLTDKELEEIYQYGVDLFFNLEDYLKHAVS